MGETENKPPGEVKQGDSKKAAKKEAKKAEKEAKKAERKSNTTESQAPPEDDVSSGKYGDFPLIRSDSKAPKRTFTEVHELNKDLSGKSVWVRGRLHTVRARGKQCFIVLRQRVFTIQVLVNVSDTISKAMVKFSSK